MSFLFLSRYFLLCNEKHTKRLVWRYLSCPPMFSASVHPRFLWHCSIPQSFTTWLHTLMLSIWALFKPIFKLCCSSAEALPYLALQEKLSWKCIFISIFCKICQDSGKNLDVYKFFIRYWKILQDSFEMQHGKFYEICRKLTSIGKNGCTVIYKILYAAWINFRARCAFRVSQKNVQSKLRCSDNILISLIFYFIRKSWKVF